MPQETKQRPSDAEEGDVAPGVLHENLEGWVPPLATEDEVRVALDKAFDYRGDVTLTRKDGTRVEGYVFDRRTESRPYAQCIVRLLPKAGGDRICVSYADIARLEFTGRDTAEGRSWTTWVRKYTEKKKAGETNIRLDPERLD
jgi:hypothetical protein